MAQTFRAGQDAFFTLSDASGSTVALSTGLDDISLERLRALHEVTAYEDDWRARIPGLNDGSISVAGHWSSTHAKTFDGLLTATTASNYVYGPESTASGRRKYTGTLWVENVNYSNPVDGKISVSLDLTFTGSQTSTDFA